MNDAFFYIWETVEWTLQLKDDEGEPVLKGYEEVVVSLKQNQTLIELETSELGIDDTNDTISIRLSQEQTSQFQYGQAEIQVNIYYEDSTRDTTVMGTIDVRNNLHKELMGNG